MAAAGSTDMGAASAGAGVTGGKKKKRGRRRGAGKKEKMTRNQLKRLKKQRERDG